MGLSAAFCRFRDIFPHPDWVYAWKAEWLSWNYGTVPAIARQLDDDGAYHDLPIRADALEDAGCDVPAFLDHCRAPGPHVR